MKTIFIIWQIKKKECDIMAVRQVPEKNWTKDGRKWMFEVRVKDMNGKQHHYRSKNYFTRKEAIQAEKNYLLGIEDKGIQSDMTFKELCDLHFDYQKDKVKVTTLRNYKKRRDHLKMFDDIKVKELNINHFEKWKRDMNNTDLATRTKNDLYKYLKSVLNYGIKWHDLTFNDMYKKMTKFDNPNELPKEMEFWTYEEFKKFINVETDILFKALFETLYYCGLRSGEVRGLNWKDIDFKNKELTVRRNIVVNFEGDKYFITTPKTKSSCRTIPMPDILVEDLNTLRKYQNNYYGFNEDWFVFGNYEPITKSKMRDRKNKNCKLANVKQIRIHDFRHSCASLLINNGANITMVAKYLGHTKIDETLNTYSHMFKGKLDNIVETINKLNR